MGDLIWYITCACNGHHACAVSRDVSPGGKSDPHVWNPWPEFVHSLCHLKDTTTNS